MTTTNPTNGPAPATDQAPEIPATTRAAVLDAFGGPELLHVTSLPLAAPGRGQVQVRVAAAAVNPVDLSTRAGRNIPVADARFPMVLGWDLAGTVVALGEGVTAWSVGDRVAAMVFQPVTQQGTYAELVDLDVDLLARVPGSLEFAHAATVPLAGLTGSQLLGTLDLSRGRSLLVDGPLGAVGRVVVTVAVAAGLEVIGVVRPDQREQLLASGAAATVARGDVAGAVRRLHPDGVDAAVDLVGGATARSTLDAVRDGGRYVTSVPAYIDPSGPFDRERAITVDVLTVRADAEVLTGLLRRAADGLLGTAVQQRFPLARAGDAHLAQAAGHLHGRIVINP